MVLSPGIPPEGRRLLISYLGAVTARGQLQEAAWAAKVCKYQQADGISWKAGACPTVRVHQSLLRAQRNPGAGGEVSALTASALYT